MCSKSRRRSDATMSVKPIAQLNLIDPEDSFQQLIAFKDPEKAKEIKKTNYSNTTGRVPAKPQGIVKLWMPNMEAFDVEFYKNEKVDVFRKRAEIVVGRPMSSYILSSTHGTMLDYMYLDYYGIEDGSNVVAIEIGISTKKFKESREVWLGPKKRRSLIDLVQTNAGKSNKKRGSRMACPINRTFV